MSVYRGATVAFGTRHGKQHQVADAFAAILGAHVTAPVTVHEEMLLFRDTRRGIEVVEGERVPLTLPGPVRVATVDQAAPFLDRACPGYGRTGAEPGLPCAACGTATDLAAATGTAAPAARTAAGCAARAHRRSAARLATENPRWGHMSIVGECRRLGVRGRPACRFDRYGPLGPSGTSAVGTMAAAGSFSSMKMLCDAVSPTFSPVCSCAPTQRASPA